MPQFYVEKCVGKYYSFVLCMSWIWCTYFFSFILCDWCHDRRKRKVNKLKMKEEEEMSKLIDDDSFKMIDDELSSKSCSDIADIDE